MTTRSEHVAWCKQRALEYLEPGQYFSVENAITSMLSDLGKHDETRSLLEATNGITALALVSGRTPSDARKFIEGFN